MVDVPKEIRDEIERKAEGEYGPLIASIVNLVEVYDRENRRLTKEKMLLESEIRVLRTKLQINLGRKREDDQAMIAEMEGWK